MSDDRASMLQDIAEVADELTDRRKHRQPYEVWTPSRHRRLQHWETDQPGLLEQLRELFEPGAGGEEGRRRKGDGPPTPLNLEAASLHTVITIAAFRWCSRLDVDQRATVEDNVRALVGAAAGVDSDRQAELLADLKGWHRRAQLLTGWTSAPFRPAAGCPYCDRGNVLVINLAAKSAFCANEECGAVWRDHGDADKDWGSIYVLAEHIRQTAERTVTV